MKYSSSCILLLLATSLLGCESQFTDTEGRTFDFKCKKGDCTISPAQGDEKSKSNHAPYELRTKGRILTVCDAKQGDFSCRPLSCQKSGTCSTLGGPEFSCEKKLCQSTSRKLQFADKLALCLAETGEWTRSADQLSRLNRSRACRPPGCDVPAICMAY